ncbi:MAG: hypothetical protein IPK98_16365 [Chloracidobacterium sp.]|nr:hypothetical protein [Chloracidobacterium sp.]
MINWRRGAALNNGNYVVGSPSWDGGVQNVGAFTWVNGAAGMSGVINSANSFVGSQSGDSVASGGITVLANGNYVVHSPLWDGGNINSGVLTYGPGNVAFTASGHRRRTWRF